MVIDLLNLDAAEITFKVSRSLKVIGTGAIK